MMKYGDYKNNDKLQEEQLLFLEEKTKAKDNCTRILEEDAVLREKESHLLIVKNRMAYLRKKIEQVNSQIDKQDNLINKIKDNQERILEKKNNVNLNNTFSGDIEQFRKENNLKKREEHKQAVKFHKEQIIRAKKHQAEKMKKTAGNLTMVKRQMDREHEQENKLK